MTFIPRILASASNAVSITSLANLTYRHGYTGDSRYCNNLLVFVFFLLNIYM